MLTATTFARVARVLPLTLRLSPRAAHCIYLSNNGLCLAHSCSSNKFSLLIAVALYRSYRSLSDSCTQSRLVYTRILGLVPLRSFADTPKYPMVHALRADSPSPDRAAHCSWIADTLAMLCASHSRKQTTWFALPYKSCRLYICCSCTSVSFVCSKTTPPMDAQITDNLAWDNSPARVGFRRWHLLSRKDGFCRADKV